MDQVKIGRFIARVRKEKEMTQRELADAIGISDKTVSKWERGNGLPEVSLMLPLCETLGISVNDLLTGERVSECDYKEKAEENMMNLLQENKENKKKVSLSIVCGLVTIVAVCSLVVIASYIEMHTAIRIMLVIFAMMVAAVGIGAAGVLENDAGWWECPHCKTEFKPTMKEYVKGYHTLTRRYLKCPECGKSSMCKHRIVRR